MKRETFEEFKERLGFSNFKSEDVHTEMAINIYLTSIFCYESKYNWRRQIVNIKNILQTFEENGKTKGNDE